jgi:hypothetical protein
VTDSLIKPVKEHVPEPLILQFKLKKSFNRTYFSSILIEIEDMLLAETWLLCWSELSPPQAGSEREIAIMTNKLKIFIFCSMKKVLSE